jgi:hypothetical protein
MCAAKISGEPHFFFDRAAIYGIRKPARTHGGGWNKFRLFFYKFALQDTNASSHLTAPFTTNPSIMGSVQVDEASFGAPPQTHSFLGVLLDFDGTIIDSTDAIVKHWHK